MIIVRTLPYFKAMKNAQNYLSFCVPRPKGGKDKDDITPLWKSEFGIILHKNEETGQWWMDLESEEHLTAFLLRWQ